MATDYELLDFGDGRKLERFGPYVLDRPAPAADGAQPAISGLWSNADARFVKRSGQGDWKHRRAINAPWTVAIDALTLELKLTDFGHVGLFPEQTDNWRWLTQQVRDADRPLEVLNLFAYTGGSTLAAAAAGARVTHVDAAANVVTWARRNAALSSLSAAPVRWICEDARKFAARELKRKHRYDGVILDPPAYGHGPKGEVWKLDEHLGELLQVCGSLTNGRPEFMLLTCHSAELMSPASLRSLFERALPQLTSGGRTEVREMRLMSTAGRNLNCGAMLRWSRHQRKARDPLTPDPSPATMPRTVPGEGSVPR